MWFGELSTEQSIGCILAHSIRTEKRRISKGTLIDKFVADELVEQGIIHITVARIEAADIEENLAANRLAVAVCGVGVRVENAHTGRVNLYAECDGLFVYDRASIVAANSVSEGITFSVLAENQWVLAGRMIGTAKIIPYAVPEKDLDNAIAHASELTVHKPSYKKIVLIQSTLTSVKTTTLDKTSVITRQRLLVRSSDLVKEVRCDHSTNAVTAALTEAISCCPDLILIIGASAISDRLDVLPVAVKNCGGEVQRVGLPVDPGNLLMLANVANVPVLGLPGCARSPKHNGLDMLLDRIACDVPITESWLNSLCIGGLLGELHDRPQPRVAANKSNNVAALVLAAGSSRRAGDTNKLLYRHRGKSIVGSVIESVLDSSVAASLVVTGHEKQLMQNAIDQYDIDVCHCAKHTEGMAHSLAAGISQLQSYDAVLVCLADMPHVNCDVINQILSAAGTRLAENIVVPVYKKQRGNPVLVGRTFFDSLLQNEGDRGARYLIKQYPDQVVEVEVDSESILQDYDTLEALQQLDSL